MSFFINRAYKFIVPPESAIGQLLIRNAHFRTLHGGVSLNKAYLRQRFWFSKIGIAIRKLTQHCPTCVRYSRRACEQLMGQMPSVRVTAAEPFSRVGVDFAGSFKLEGCCVATSSGGCQTICRTRYCQRMGVVFVCLAIRAVGRRRGSYDGGISKGIHQIE